jgi:hypothetical protein
MTAIDYYRDNLQWLIQYIENNPGQTGEAIFRAYRAHIDNRIPGAGSA